MTSRVRLLVPLLLLVVAIAAVGGWVLVRDDGPYTHALQRFSDDDGEANRFHNLPEEAQFSIGSPDGHRLVVQWRDPDGHGWTAPDTSWNDPDLIAVDNTIRYGGGTFGIVETYVANVHDESDIGDISIGLVCRDRACDARRMVRGTGDPQVTPDGSTALLDADRDGPWFWTAESGFVHRDWSGERGLFTYSGAGPLLAPDGSLRAVVSRPSREACTFRLLTSAPREADFTEVAARRADMTGSSRSTCDSYLDTFSSDWLTVHSYDHRAGTFWFQRTGETWGSTTRDPSGLQLVDRRRGCCDTAIAGFVHWNDVAFSSTDGRSIQIQTHLLGEETWSEPVVLRGVPAGFRCTWIDGTDVPDGAEYAVAMDCQRGREQGRLVAVTPDLQTWTAAWESAG